MRGNGRLFLVIITPENIAIGYTFDSVLIKSLEGFLSIVSIVMIIVAISSAVYHSYKM